MEFRIITQINNSREMLKDTFKGSSHFYAKLVKFSILVANNFFSVISFTFFLILVSLTKIVNTTV